MKTIVCALVLVMALPVIAAALPLQQEQGQTFDVFYSSLSPFGEWIPIEGGAYAWRPRDVASDWRPYVHGHWLWSDQGWYWWSQEPWAWATYHYGRWYYDEYYGWIWIPGYDWAPAWVEWRYGGDVIGWAPLGPYAIYAAPIGIRYDRYWVTPARWWTFVGCGAFTRHDLWHHVQPMDQNDRYLYGSRSIGSVRYSGTRTVVPGPDRVFIERRTNARLENVEMVDVHSEKEQKLMENGGRERLQVYRPPINHSGPDQADRPPANMTRDRRELRLDPRGMDRPVPSVREGGDRPARPEIHQLPRNNADRNTQQRPEWRFNGPSRRLEGQRPRQVEPGDGQGTRPAAPRGNVREGKKDGK